MELSLWNQVLADIPSQGRKHIFDVGMHRCNIATKDNGGRAGGGGKGHLESRRRICTMAMDRNVREGAAASWSEERHIFGGGTPMELAGRYFHYRCWQAKQGKRTVRQTGRPGLVIARKHGVF